MGKHLDWEEEKNANGIELTPLSIESQKRDGFSPPRPSHGLQIQRQSFCRDTEIAILHTQLEILCNMQTSKEDDNENTTTTTTVNAADAITTTPVQRMLVDRNVTNATTCITPFQMNINNTAAAITPPPLVESTAMVNKNSKNMCQSFKLCFELWDAAFSLARKYEPTGDDAAMYQRFVDAAVNRHIQLGLSVTPKVHLMHKHVRWQMENIEGGLGDKMEDGIEKSHQVGKQKRGQFGTVQNLQTQAEARERVVHRNSDPRVVSETLKVILASKRKLTGEIMDKERIKTLREREQNVKRLKALEMYEMMDDK